MGFRNSHVTEKRNDDMTILFYDFETIFVQSKKTPQILIFHKWYSPRGFYGQSFSPFRRYLMASKNLSLYNIISRAQRHGICVEMATKLPDLQGKKIKVIGGQGEEIIK